MAHNKEALQDHKIARRSLVWGIIILLLALVALGPWRLASVGGTTMAPKLGNGEYYSAVIPSKICLGDLIQIKDKPNSRTLVCAVVSFNGSVFSLTDNGYAIDEKPVEMSQMWLKNAHQQMPPSGKLTIPDDKILVMRTAPDNANSDNYEAYLLIDINHVDRVLERVLITFDPKRIGMWLRSDNKICIPFS